MGLADGLVLDLPIDEGKGTILYDRSDFGNDGTIHGATWKRTSTGLWVLYFDGVDDYVEIPNSPSLQIAGAITIEAWVWADWTMDTWGMIVGQVAWDSTGFILGRHSDVNQLRCSINPGPGDYQVVSQPISEKQWYHVAATHDGIDKLRIYINADESPYSPVTGAPVTASSAPTYISESGTEMRWKGFIGEVRIYNRTLSPAEILALY